MSVIPNRGIKSKDAMYLPDLRKMPNPQLRWEVEDILIFIFPREIQFKYNTVAQSFIKQLLSNANDGLNGDQIAAWLRETKFSAATFYNRVLPRLIRLGMVERKRMRGQKSRKMLLHPSTSFGLYMQKLGSEWSVIVNTARAKSKNRFDITSLAY